MNKLRLIKLRNTFIYYCAVIIPFVLLISLSKNNQLSSDWFVIVLFFYVFIFRTIIDYFRLLSKKAITKKDFWKLLIPFSKMKYFGELYFP